MMRDICGLDDLIENSGVCALVEGEQIALFYVPATEQQVFALGNWDPIGKANVLSRGIVGDIGDELVVASPLFKQHFSLLTGQCIEEDVAVPTYPVALKGDKVIMLSTETSALAS